MRDRVGSLLPRLFVEAGVGVPDGTDVTGRLERLADASLMLEAVLRSLLPLAVGRGIVTEPEAETLLAQLHDADAEDPERPVLWPVDGRVETQGLNGWATDGDVMLNGASPDRSSTWTGAVALRLPRPGPGGDQQRGELATPARAALGCWRALTHDYDNVHRGQSTASRRTTALFEASYDTFAQWLNAPSRRSIATYRNTTEAINAVMYTLLTEFRDGDNVVTTMMEHNSNFVPWYGMCHEILPRFGRRVECRVARFDHRTGALDLEHLAGLVDERTKLVCVTGASNFLGTKPPLSISAPSRTQRVPATTAARVADAGRRGTARAQHLRRRAAAGRGLPGLLVPQDVGAVRRRRALREGAPARSGRPFLYGGDMIAEGQVAPDRVEYNDLPWKYAAGTPNILGVIASAQALRLLVDLVGPEGAPRWFDNDAAAAIGRRIGDGPRQPAHPR